MIESTAYGVRAIVEAFESGGLTINEIRASGGIAKKDPMMMQIYADVLGRELAVVDTEQGGAQGSAIYAAVAAGAYPTVRRAAEVMSVKSAEVYRPIEENNRVYNAFYAEYIRLYDYFGRGENTVMSRLRRIAGGTL
jgi:L-ribulokinase